MPPNGQVPAPKNSDAGLILGVIVIFVFLGIIGFLVYWFRDTLFPPSPSPEPSSAPGPSGADLPTTPEAYNQGGGSDLVVTPGVGTGPSGGPSEGPSGALPACNSSLWSACNPTCNDGVTPSTKVYTGPDCVNGDGSVTNRGDTLTCSVSPCGQDCLGSWERRSSCPGSQPTGSQPVSCAFAEQVDEFVETQESRGGQSCTSKYGQPGETVFHGARRVQACTLPQSCSVPVQNCVGEWRNTDWQGCDKICGGGLRRRYFRVTTPALNGGQQCTTTQYPTTGTVQNAPGGVLTAASYEEEPCNTIGCCDDPRFFTQWQAEPRASNMCGNPPFKHWNRGFITGASGTCASKLRTTTTTAQGCDEVPGSSVMCSNGGTFSTAGRLCTSAPTQRGTNYSCTEHRNDRYYDERNSLYQVGTDVAGNGCFKKHLGSVCRPLGSCSTTYVNPPWVFAPDQISSYDCPPTHDKSNGVCVGKPSSVVDYTCPQYWEDKSSTGFSRAMCQYRIDNSRDAAPPV